MIPHRLKTFVILVTLAPLELVVARWADRRRGERRPCDLSRDHW
jgi:hypothetical protein